MKKMFIKNVNMIYMDPCFNQSLRSLFKIKGFKVMILKKKMTKVTLSVLINLKQIYFQQIQ